ncbi:MAG: hypothetical protein ACKOCW_07995 [Planctomycetaceae bacterium]
MPSPWPCPPPARRSPRRDAPLLDAWLVGAALLGARLLGAAPAAHAETVGGLGAPDRIEVRGLTTIEPERLARPLAADDELVWFTRPTASRDAYLRALERKAEQTMFRAGFPTALVGASVEHADGRERVVLSVAEGPRFEAGPVTVSGLPDDVARRLVETLTTAPGDRAGHDPATGRGTTAPIWPPSGPAPCDETTLRRARAACVGFLRDEGYVGLAPPSERRAGGLWALAFGAKPSREAGPVAVRIDQGEGNATLAVTVGALPPKVRLTRVEVAPGATTKHDELTAWLGITPGTPVTDRDRRAWQERLRGSGRFLRQEVELRVDPLDPAAAVARFTLEEYPPLLPLRRPLSREEETLLRGRDWIAAALAGGTDLVAELTLATAEEPPPGAMPSARLVVSGTAGLVVTAPAAGPDACGFVVLERELRLLPPGGTGRFDVALPLTGRITASLGLSLDRHPPPAAGAAGAASPRTFTRHLALGMGMSAGGDIRPGFGLELNLDPVAWLALLHEGRPQTRWEGEELIVTDDEGFVVRFDGPTGRPVSVVTKQARLTLSARPGALADDVARLTAAAGPDRADATRPLSTAVEFLLSAEVAAACERLAHTFGPVGDDRATWERAARVVATAARKCLLDEALARADRQLAAWIAAVTTPAATDDLVVPAGEPAGGGKPPLTRQAAAFAWRLAERVWDHDSWPMALVRTGACAAVGSPAALEEVTLFMGARDHGPLAHAIAATVCPMPPLAATLARRGQERLSMVAFHTDCYPLTAALGPAGLEDVLVAVLRGIDDDAARDLGTALAGDGQLFMPLVERLRAFPTHQDAMVGLQQSLDAWWLSSLKDVVARRLAAIATPRTAAVSPEEEPVTK